MPNPNPMFLEKPFSLAHARRMSFGSDPLKLSLLIPLLFHDYSFDIDEFMRSLDTTRWTEANSAGGAQTPFAYSAVRTGGLQGITGTTSDAVVAVHRTETFLDPDDNPFMFIQWKANIVAGFSFEVGLSNPKSSEALPGVTSVDTPTVGNGATDLIAVHMDTDASLATAALVGDGSTGDAVAETIYRGGPGATGTTAYTPTPGYWQTYLIGTRDNIGYAAIWDGDAFMGRYTSTNAPDGGVLVRPYALFRTRNTTSKTIDIRTIAIGCEHNE